MKKSRKRNSGSNSVNMECRWKDWSHDEVLILSGSATYWADPHYGADADGRRGMFVDGYEDHEINKIYSARLKCKIPIARMKKLAPKLWEELEEYFCENAVAETIDDCPEPDYDEPSNQDYADWETPDDKGIVR